MTAVAAAPASAVPGGCSGTTQPVQSCVDWGYYGDNVRADFYLNTGASSTYHSYQVYLVVSINSGSDNWHNVGGGTLGGQGHYCCWYTLTHSAPLVTYHVRTVIDVFDASGFASARVTSPTITYVN